MSFNKNFDDFSEFLPGIYTNRRRRNSFFTKSANTGSSVYGENIFYSGDFEYRLWDPKRSKLGALFQKRAKISFPSNSKVLYLGAASGTTVSHVSDILADKNSSGDGSGVVYSVEFSERPMRDLTRLATERRNIIPILSDASDPLKYSSLVEPIDIIFQDIAQPNQAEIAIRNSSYFLKEGGKLILSIKSRSISAIENPKKVYKQEIKKLELGNESIYFTINNTYDLAPFHIDHLGVVATINYR